MNDQAKHQKDSEVQKTDNQNVTDKPAEKKKDELTDEQVESLSGGTAGQFKIFKFVG